MKLHLARLTRNRLADYSDAGRRLAHLVEDDAQQVMSFV